MTGINRNIQNTNLDSTADDTRIWHLLNTTHSSQHLQAASDQIYIWVEDNNMLFNGKKFELLNFGKSTRPFHYETPQGKQSEAKESVRDLRIIFEPNGRFDKHITSVMAKGNCMEGWILWMFKTCTKEIMLTLLKTCSCTTSRIWMYHLDANFSKLSKLN